MEKSFTFASSQASAWGASSRPSTAAPCGGAARGAHARGGLDFGGGAEKRHQTRTTPTPARAAQSSAGTRFDPRAVCWWTGTRPRLLKSTEGRAQRASPAPALRQARTPCDGKAPAPCCQEEAPRPGRDQFGGSKLMLGSWRDGAEQPHSTQAARHGAAIPGTAPSPTHTRCPRMGRAHGTSGPPGCRAGGPKRTQQGQKPRVRHRDGPSHGPGCDPAPSQAPQHKQHPRRDTKG